MNVLCLYAYVCTLCVVCMCIALVVCVCVCACLYVYGCGMYMREEWWCVHIGMQHLTLCLLCEQV